MQRRRAIRAAWEDIKGTPLTTSFIILTSLPYLPSTHIHTILHIYVYTEQGCQKALEHIIDLMTSAAEKNRHQSGLIADDFKFFVTEMDESRDESSQRYNNTSHKSKVKRQDSASSRGSRGSRGGLSRKNSASTLHSRMQPGGGLSRQGSFSGQSHHEDEHSMAARTAMSRKSKYSKMMSIASSGDAASSHDTSAYHGSTTDVPARLLGLGLQSADPDDGFQPELYGDDDDLLSGSEDEDDGVEYMSSHAASSKPRASGKGNLTTLSTSHDDWNKQRLERMAKDKERRAKDEEKKKKLEQEKLLQKVHPLLHPSYL